MSIIKEYRASLKNPAVEEWPDLVIFRPIAFLFVKIFCLFPITPNQISYLAMITGIVSAVYFTTGEPFSFIMGALFYGLSNVIDCSDGMVARLKKNGTVTGRIIDGFVDYIVSIAVYVGLGIGLTTAVEQHWIQLPFQVWPLVFAAGFSKVFHSIVTDSYRKLYEGYVIGDVVTPQQEIEKYSSELEKLNRSHGHGFDKFLIKGYIKYSKLQISKVKQEPIQVPPEIYKRYNLWIIQLWNFAGPTAHIVFVILAAILYEPMLYFIYAIIFANLWVLLLLPVQVCVNRRLFRKQMPGVTG